MPLLSHRAFSLGNQIMVRLWLDLDNPVGSVTVVNVDNDLATSLEVVSILMNIGIVILIPPPFFLAPSWLEY